LDGVGLARESKTGLCHNPGVQGVYRVWIGTQELLETFVAAPGPMGWRYFGRARHPESDREAYVVDHVVDVNWNLVRFRWSVSDGTDVVAVPAVGGIEVWAGNNNVLVPGVTGVWTASPSSLMVMQRLLGTSAEAEVRAVRLEQRSEPAPVVVRVRTVEALGVAASGEATDAQAVVVDIDGRRIGAVLRRDLPFRADGWFELVG
jgi:hypothetical protein